MSMTDLFQLLLRIKSGQSNTFIHNNYGTHKTVIRKLRRLAALHDWLNPLTGMPDEVTLQKTYYQDSPVTLAKSVSLLSAHNENIKRWIKEEKSFVVMHTLLKDKLGEQTPSETTVRHYIHKTFPEKIKPVMIREHEYGCAEIDFGYLGIVYDPTERRNRKAHFISCRFAFSRHAYRKIIFKLDIAATIHSLEECFRYFDAVPCMMVLDNFKAAVQKASIYDPTITALFYEFAKYYGILLSPCRAYTPEHKGGVESDVKYVKRNFWPIFSEREKNIGHETPSTENLQNALDEWTKNVNDRKLKLQEKTIPQLFDEEFEHLKSIPMERFDIVGYAKPVVRRDYHVQFENNFYSVPDKLIRKKVELFAHFRQICILFDNEIVAVHEKLTGRGKRSTKKEHCTDITSEYMSYSKEVVKSKASSIGSATFKVIEKLLEDKVIDRLRSARGIVFLVRQYSPQRIESACTRALVFNNINYPSIKAILNQNMDQLPLEEAVDINGQCLFSFARNGDYYQNNFKKENHNG